MLEKAGKAMARKLNFKVRTCLHICYISVNSRLTVSVQLAENSNLSDVGLPDRHFLANEVLCRDAHFITDLMSSRRRRQTQLQAKQPRSLSCDGKYMQEISGRIGTSDKMPDAAGGLAAMKKALRVCSTLFVVYAVCATATAPQVLAVGSSGSNRARAFGTVTGSVRDAQGNPLSGAVVSLIRDGANKIVRQTRSGQDGGFNAKVAPGLYNLRAVADGFQDVLFSSVQVRASDELVYRFNLEPTGTGRSAPEQRTDRDDAKWIIRAAQSRRSIFQMHEGDSEAIEIARAAEEQAATEDVEDASAGTENSTHSSTNTKAAKVKSSAQGVVETYFASTNIASTNSFASNYAGLNFAFAQPVNERLELILSGQTGTSALAPQRLEGTARIRVADNRHRLSLRTSGAHVATILPSRETTRTQKPLLGQVSVRAIDEWVARDGVVVVLGFDYSRFVGASQAQSISPRFGVQYDANARTRLRAAYAPGGDDEEATMSAAKFEDGEVAFKQTAAKPVALAHNRVAKMERSRRLEFGIERVLDNSSSVEATAFFDTTSNRGVGLLSLPLSAFANETDVGITEVADQEGAARGVRVVYAKRLSKIVSTSAGYSFGRGQKLSPNNLTNPAEVFSNGFFQSGAVQMSADLGTGTRVQTVFRFSPRATVFAIDPFAGRLAVYDPSLSVVVTQGLPTFGLPVRAEAILDARNLLDTQPSTDDGDTRVAVGTSSRRSVRGGLSVRF